MFPTLCIMEVTQELNFYMLLKYQEGWYKILQEPKEASIRLTPRSKPIIM